MRRHCIASIALLIAGLYVRMIYDFKQQPFPIGKAVDPRLSKDEGDDEKDRLASMCRCCKDEACGIPLSYRLQSRTDWDDPQVERFLTALWRNSKVCTVPVEERFKRLRTYNTSNSGNTQKLSTLCSNYCLGEIKHLWKLSKEIHCKEKKRIAQSAKRKRKKTTSFRKSSVWQIHRQRVKKKNPKSGNESSNAWFSRLSKLASKEWRELPEAEKSKVSARAQRQNQVRRWGWQRQRPTASQAERPLLTPSQTAWNLGDDKHGLSRKLLEETMDEAKRNKENFVTKHHEEWVFQYGDLVRQNEHAQFPVEIDQEQRVTESKEHTCNSKLAV